MTASWSVCQWVCVCLISTRICFTDSLEPIGKTVAYDCTKSNMRSMRSFICHAFSTSFWMYISMYQIPEAIHTNICFCFSLYSTKESIVVSAFQILCMLAPVTSVLCDPFLLLYNSAWCSSNSSSANSFAKPQSSFALPRSANNFYLIFYCSSLCSLFFFSSTTVLWLFASIALPSILFFLLCDII